MKSNNSNIKDFILFSKHCVAKNTVESANNFKNVSLTVAERQQLRMSSIYYRGMFEPHEYVILGESTQSKNIIEKGEFWDKIQEFIGEDDTVCDGILVFGQIFKKGDVVVLEVLSGGDSLKVGLVKMFLIKGGKVYFAVREYVARKTELGFYVTMHVSAETKFAAKLADTKPLILRGTPTKFQFVLHHNISFDYN